MGRGIVFWSWWGRGVVLRLFLFFYKSWRGGQVLCFVLFVLLSWQNAFFVVGMAIFCPGGAVLFLSLGGGWAQSKTREGYCAAHGRAKEAEKKPRGLPRHSISKTLRTQNERWVSREFNAGSLKNAKPPAHFRSGATKHTSALSYPAL